MRPDQAFDPIRALQSAWKILMKAPLPMWVGGLILVIVQSAAGAAGNPNFNFKIHHGGEAILAFLIPLVLIGLTVGIAVWLLASWLSVGYFNGVATVMRTGDYEFEKLFDARGRWISMFLTRLLQGFLIFLAALTLGIGPLMGVIAHEGLRLDEGFAAAIGVLGFLVCLPVFFYVLLGLLLAPYAAALEDVNPIEAVARSWSLARGNRLMLLIFLLATILLAFVGLLMCCVCVLPASILIEVMWVEAYVQATQVDNYDEWWIRGVSPSPRTSPPTAAVAPGFSPEPPPEEPPPRQVPEPEPPPDAGVGGPFDPGGWREQADIPPIDEEEGPKR